MALALRYHYSSIDRPALKSKSHLVAQAIVSGSGDHVYMFVFVRLGVCVCLCKCSENVCVSSLVVFSKFFFFFFLLSLPLSPPSLSWIKVRQDQSPNVCFMCQIMESDPTSPDGTYRHSRRLVLYSHSYDTIYILMNWLIHTFLHEHTPIQFTPLTLFIHRMNKSICFKVCLCSMYLSHSHIASKSH